LIGAGDRGRLRRLRDFYGSRFRADHRRDLRTPSDAGGRDRRDALVQRVMPGEERTMSATVDREPEQSPEVAEKLRRLRIQEAALEQRESALEQRTSRLELSNPLGILLAFAALAIAIGALVIALANRSDSRSMMNGGVVTGTATSGTGMMGSTSSTGTGMMRGRGTFSAGQVSAAATGTVYVNLGEYWVQPAVASVRAGKVTFIAKNLGQMPHELMIERAPIKMNAPNQPNEDAAQGMIDDMSSGQSGRMTVRLSPGSYVLFCNITGHYAAGQHTTFTITKS
jgi:uncharacterized cupredoxin-like copper-binding protein